jgi:MFS family permease
VLAVTFVAFEALAVATIVPLVGRRLGDLRLYGWVFSAFMLASLIGIVVAGTLADRVPLRQPMLAGLALFVAGLVVGGTAPDMAVLVAGRAVQGLGAGVVPGLVGPGIATLVAAAVGWRWVFLGLIPLVDRYLRARLRHHLAWRPELNVDCTRSTDVASDFVALDDRLLQPVQGQRRSEQGKCHHRPVVQLTHSAREQHSLYQLHPLPGGRETIGELLRVS